MANRNVEMRVQWYKPIDATSTELTEREADYLQFAWMKYGLHPDGATGNTTLHKSTEVAHRGIKRRKQWLTTENSETTDAWRTTLKKAGYLER